MSENVNADMFFSSPSPRILDLFVSFVFHSPSCLTPARSGDAQYVCRFLGEKVRLYSGMKWMLQSVSGLKHGESVRISRRGCR